MNCVIEGNCVKVFGKAIHSLSRIGAEFWLDPMVKGLAVRSVNSAHTASACFLFSPLFFKHYSLASESEQHNGAVKCKLLMRSVLPLFRCLTSIERNVEQCQITIDCPGGRVIILFFCRHGITKTYNMRFQESEALQAVFASHLCPNVLKVQAKFFGDMVTHFPATQEEISLSMTSHRVNLRSYYEENALAEACFLLCMTQSCLVTDYMKMMHTEMSLHPNEFDYYQVRVDSDIIFCLKELRGLLSFAESLCLPVTAHFGPAGMPASFSVEDLVLEARVVLATLMNSDSRGSSQPTQIPNPAIPRCRAAAAPPVSPCEAPVPAETEMVPSSQGSLMFSPPVSIKLLPRTEGCDTLGVFDEVNASVASTPASSQICSLLFRATSSEQHDDDNANMMHVLACYSDEEEAI